MLLVVVLIIWSVVVSSCTVSGKTSSGGSSAEIQTSTIRRERLNSSSLVNVGWYTDNLDWIRDPDKLEKGLAYFYKRTGVSPYLYLTEDAEGVLDPTAAQLDAFAGELYDTLFRDEAHFLVVFQEHNGVYNTRYVCGLEARAVMDDEACEILLDYLDAYYFGDYDDEIRSIMEKLIWLDPSIEIFPGHGPSSSIGCERTGNPFLEPWGEAEEETDPENLEPVSIIH